MLMRPSFLLGHSYDRLNIQNSFGWRFGSITELSTDDALPKEVIFHLTTDPKSTNGSMYNCVHFQWAFALIQNINVVCILYLYLASHNLISKKQMA